MGEYLDCTDNKGFYQTSSMQKRIYASCKMNPGATDYNITQGVFIHHAINKERLTIACKKLIVDHEALRTSFHMVDGELVQRIDPPWEPSIVFSQAKNNLELNDLIDNFTSIFDFACGRLIQFMLVQMTEERYCLAIDAHHIIMDGFSMVTLFKKIIGDHNGLSEPINAMQPKDIYIKNKRELKEKIQRYREYWLPMFEQGVPILDLPFDHPLNMGITSKARRYETVLSSELSGLIKKVSEIHNVTNFVVLLAAFHILLHKSTGQDDIVIGIPTAGRIGKEQKDAVGLFINTIPFRMTYSSEITVAGMIQDISRKFRYALTYQNYPFDEIITKLALKKELNRNFFFDVMFSYYNKNFSTESSLYEKYNYKSNDAQYFISMNIDERFDTTLIEFEYYRDLFDEKTIELLSNRYIKILELLTSNEIDKKISELQILPEQEYNQVMVSFNKTAVEIDLDKSVVEIIEHNVSKNPHKTAVIFDDQILSYQQVNERANQLARLLIEHGVCEENIVGLLMNRSNVMLESILGIWKTGAAYIPIDTNYPADRISNMYHRSGAKFLLVTRENLTEELVKKLEDTVILCLDDFDISSFSKENINKKFSPDTMAYIIFTSGSTGLPKGAIVEQKGMYNHMSAKKSELQISEDSVILQNASHCFDISVWQFFNALLYGGTTVILSEGIVLNIKKFFEYVMKHKITIVEVVPSFLRLMIPVLKDHPEYTVSIKYLLITGEKAPKDVVKGWFDLNNGIPMVNAYGPTEASDDITHYTMTSCPDDINIPVGKPIQNMRIYIIDKDNHACGIGVKGELIVAGIGVGRGYIGDPEKTIASFCPNPLENSAQEIVYKTGDIGKWLHDGNIQYLERKDYQVKIRGFRIELGEIEANIQKSEAVQQVVVLDKETENGDKYLCAYIVPVDESTFDVEEIKGKLAMHLPYYMIPEFFVKLKEVPTNENGKIDRIALLKISAESPIREKVRPATWDQKKIALIWSEVLEIDSIGIDDNFFELGGHSLKAISMIDFFEKEFGILFEVEDIFSYNTVRKQAEFIANSKREKSSKSSIKKVELTEIELSSAQRRVFVASNFLNHDVDKLAYNMPAIFRLAGTLDVKRVEDALQELLSRHSSLRVSLKDVEGEPIQFIQTNSRFKLEQYENVQDDVEQLLSELIRPFDLYQDSLFRVALIKDQRKYKYIFFDMHHIISDGISLQILATDFIRLYNGESLKPIEYDYLDFVSFRKEIKNTIDTQKNYWLDLFQSEIPRLNLQTDHKRPNNLSYRGENIKHAFNAEISARLIALAKTQDVTLNILLFSIFNVLMHKYTDNEDIVVGTVTSGRNESAFENVIGMFVNTLAIRTQINAEESYINYLLRFKKTILEALKNQDYQFDDLVEELGAIRNISNNPIFDVLFVMQNDNLSSIRLNSLRMEPIDIKRNTAKFDLEFETYIDDDGSIAVNLSYKSEIFEKKTMRKLIHNYGLIIDAVLKGKNVKIRDISLCQKEDIQLIHTFNDTRNGYDEKTSMVDLFMESVRNTPDAVAVEINDSQLSYRELNRFVDASAIVLSYKGVLKNDVVAILMDNSIEMIVSMLAILKLGAIYVPIDGNLPESRIETIIKDCNPKVLIYYDTKYSSYNEIVQMLHFDDISLKTEGSIASECTGNDTACIVYTSGTTGVPKGNLITHKAIIRVVCETNYISIYKHDVILQTANYAFDGSLFNIFGALLNGAKLVLFEKEYLLDSNYISKLIISKRVSVFFVTTSLFNVWVDTIGESFKDVRCIVFGGEKASEQHCRKALSQLQSGYIVNGYGPTESTVFTTTYAMYDQKDVMETIPIGKVLTNTEVYILDKTLGMKPIDVVGEIYISGDGLIKEYLNNPALTKEKFIKNPHTGATMYRTGDFGKWNRDGTVQYIGRMDTQIKKNGFRIELEEIESALRLWEDAKEVAVICLENNFSLNILAFLTGIRQYDEERIKKWLRGYLPLYCIPNRVIAIDQMPLNRNGKIDKSELEKYEFPTSSDCQEECSERQLLVKEAFQLILNIDKMGIHDDFFESGGDSIKAIQLVAELKKRNLQVSTKDIFTNSTISMLSEVVRDSYTSDMQESVVGEVGMLPIMKHLLAQNKDLAGFVQSVVLQCNEDIDVSLLEQSITRLMREHDMLRATFNGTSLYCNDISFQCQPVLTFDLKEELYPEEKMTASMRHIKDNFNLESGPFIQAAMFYMRNKIYLFITIHHFVIDAVSWRIFLDDLVTTYALIRQESHETGIYKTDSYKKWVDILNDYFDVNGKELTYWSNIDEMNTAKISQKSDGVARIYKNSKKLSKIFSPSISRSLEQEIHHAYCTKVNHILIASLIRAINQCYSISGNIRIMMESHGREIHEERIDLSRTIGWFTSLYPIVFHIPSNGHLSDFIIEAKDKINAVPNNGIGYGLKKYGNATTSDSLDVGSEEIIFNYLGAITNQTNGIFSLSPVDQDDQDDKLKMLAKLEVSAGIYDSVLQLEIIYSTLDYDEEEIKTLLDHFEDALNQIVEWTSRQSDSVLTKSDLSDASITKEDLSAIMGMF